MPSSASHNHLECEKRTRVSGGHSMMTPYDYELEARKYFKKMGIQTYGEFLELAGYSKANEGRSFYTSGVSKRAIAFLNLIKEKYDNPKRS